MRCTVFIAGLFLLAIAGCNTSPAANDTVNKTITGYLPVADSKLYYEVTGEGEPLLLLHGGLLDRRMWDQQVNALSSQYKIITLDQRAHGLTQDGDSAYYMYEAVRLLLDSLHIPKATIGGLSMGAMVATDFAIAYPQYTEKLVLVTPGLSGSAQDAIADSFVNNHFKLLADAVRVKHDTALAAEYFIHAWFDGPFRQPAETDTAQRRLALMMCTERLKTHTGQTWLRFADTPAIKNIRSIKMPVLVISTDKDNASITRNVDTLLKAIPHARHVLIKNTAHMPNMEKPEEFNKALREFLEERVN